MDLAERAESSGSGMPDGADGPTREGLKRAMHNLEHELARLAYSIEKKRHPMRELERELYMLAFVMEARRDPTGLAMRLNGMARATHLYGKPK